jgi:hypothetical protein
MAIFFGRRPEEQHTRVPNLWARDPKLSFKAKGLLTYLLSHQDGYRLTVEQVIAEATDGKAAVYSAIRELVERGYLRRVQRRGAAGKVGEVDYFVADAPDATASQFAASRKPESGAELREQDETAGQTASRFPASRSSASGKSATKKTISKNTKDLEAANTISLSAREGATDPGPSAPALIRERDEPSSLQEPTTLPHQLLAKNNIPAEKWTDVEAALVTRHNVRSPAWWRKVDGTGDLPALVADALKDLTEDTGLAKPPWCGECDERTRQRTTEGTATVSLSRCHRCHPLVVADRSPADQRVAAGAELYRKYAVMERRGSRGQHIPYQDPVDQSEYDIPL